MSRNKKHKIRKPYVPREVPEILARKAETDRANAYIKAAGRYGGSVNPAGRKVGKHIGIQADE